MHVRWGSEDGIRRLTTQDPQYGFSETVQYWPAYDDQGVGIGGVPPAGALYRVRPCRLITTGAGSYFDLGQGAFVAVP
jgi:hypothetical protein